MPCWSSPVFMSDLILLTTQLTASCCDIFTAKSVHTASWSSEKGKLNMQTGLGCWWWSRYWAMNCELCTSLYSVCSWPGLCDCIYGVKRGPTDNQKIQLLKENKEKIERMKHDFALSCSFVMYWKALQRILQFTVIHFSPFSFSSHRAGLFCLCQWLCKITLNEVWREF